MVFLVPILSVAQSNEKIPARTVVGQYLAEKAITEKTSASVEYRLGDDIEEKNETRSIFVQQQHNGIDLRGAVMGVFITKKGKRLTNDDLADEVQVNTNIPALNAEQAVRAAMQTLGGFPLIASLKTKKTADDVQMTSVFDKGNIAAGDFKARLVYVPTAYKSKSFRLAWETQSFTKDRQNYWLAFVDAQNGKVLESQDLVLHCSFGGVEYDHSEEEHTAHIHQEHLMHLEAAERMELIMETEKESAPIPFAFENFAFTTSAVAGLNHTFTALALPADSPYDSGNQTQVSVSDGDETASPYGWTSLDGTSETNNTQGNNAHAFYDPSPGPLGGAPASATVPTTPGGVGSSDWNYVWDLSEEPEYVDAMSGSFPNRDAAIVNLFYMNNMMHDIFYPFGFDEKHRNFQSTNVIDGVDRGGTGKQGGDHVLAQAQDGGGTNNANMLTLADGTNGQMQMYLWTGGAGASNLVKIDANNFDSDYISGFEYNAVQGSFANAPGANVDLNANPVMNKEYVIINDGCTGVTGINSVGTTGCGVGAPMSGAGLPPCNDIGDKIVIIDRGDCSFVEKVNGAEQATPRPAGIIVVNNDQDNPDAVIAMGGEDAAANAITTPVVMISFNSGVELKAAIAAAQAAAPTSVITGSLQQDNPSFPKRDGDFDNGVIGHEYGHGISTRNSIRDDAGLGNLSGAEQGGEGWSDFWGLYITLRSAHLTVDPLHSNGKLPTRGIGNYVTYQASNGPGIRPRPYSIDFDVNEYTFAGTAANRLGVGDVNPDSPHGVGFIWCTMLYGVLQNFIDLYGFNDDIFNDASDLTTAGGNNVFNRLLIRGIQLQNTSTFEEQRDGILLADEELYEGRHRCLIYRAFANRGLGANAQGSDTTLGGEVDGFNLPIDCSGAGVATLTIEAAATVTKINNNSTVTYIYTVDNATPFAAVSTSVIADLPVGSTNITADNGGVIGTDQVSWNIGALAESSSLVLTVTATVNAATVTLEDFCDDMEGDETKWTTVDGGLIEDVWTTTTNEPNTGTKAWFVPDPNNNSDQSLQLANAVTIPNNGELVFYHKYATETGFDGGIVEYAATAAGPWTDIEPLITENSYSDNIAAGDNPVLRLAGGMVYGGSSGGYITTKADLSTLAGQDLIFRWRFVADVGTGAVGWSIDNVVIGTDITFVRSTATVTSGSSGFAAPVSVADDTDILITSFVLPVSLVNFDAQARDKDIILNWVTAQEKNNKGFYIERRTEDETNFRTIGWKGGKGDSDNDVYYNFVDKTAAVGLTYYYRLNQEDFDGKTAYSDVRKARIETLENEITLQPNPTRGLVNLTWKRAIGTYQVEVFDAAGRLVLREDNLHDASYRIDLSSNTDQIYMVRITTADEVISKRLVVAN